MEEFCKRDLNYSLHKLISFRERIGRERHFVDKKDAFSLTAKSWGEGYLEHVPPSSYVSETKHFSVCSTPQTLRRSGILFHLL